MCDLGHTRVGSRYSALLAVSKRGFVRRRPIVPQHPIRLGLRPAELVKPRGTSQGDVCDLYQRARVNDCNGHLHQRGRMQQNAASFNQRRSSCFARSVSLSSPPPLSARPLSLRPRHRPGDVAAGSAGSMADTTKDGAIAVSDTGTAAARAGAISIRPAASDRRQHRDDARLLRRGRVIHNGSYLVIRECLLTEEHLSPPVRKPGDGRSRRRPTSGGDHRADLYYPPL